MLKSKIILWNNINKIKLNNLNKRSVMTLLVYNNRKKTFKILINNKLLIYKNNYQTYLNKNYKFNKNWLKNKKWKKDLVFQLLKEWLLNLFKILLIQKLIKLLFNKEYWTKKIKTYRNLLIILLNHLMIIIILHNLTILKNSNKKNFWLKWPIIWKIEIQVLKWVIVNY